MRRKKQTGNESGNPGMSEGMMLLTGMKEWRQQHPKATFREIEEAVDERLARVRAGMLEDLAKMSTQADWSELPGEQRPRCEQCGTPLVSRGKQKRRLQTSGGKPGRTRTHLRDLSAVRTGDFSPWIRNWSC